ncbi:MAG: AmmeMemoRadiSam system protein A [Magnetospirillum sp. WYHS-4]
MTVQENAFEAATRRLVEVQGERLLRLAAASIEHGLKHHRPLPIDLADFPPDLQAQGACFVTLHREDRLRGCIGSPMAHQPLARDVAENAFSAAFRDPRFPQLSSAEIAGLDLSISLLSAQSPIPFADEAGLLAALRPHLDGLVIADGARRALFLPSVWEQLPDPRQFLGHLKMKAGMPVDHFSPAFRAWRFVALELKASALPDPASLWSRP